MDEESVPENVTRMSRPLISNSPPPNCAICLGTCTNKSFSDTCRHQFCFTCLLEWSKIKPECPLCKQRFTTIIHNIKSNNEYDEHIVNQIRSDVEFVPDEFLYIPTPHQASSRHFQFRTTFTVDPRGEFAIQQMLLSHPLTNSVAWPHSYANSHRRYRRARRDVSSTNYRRSIYESNLWVVPLSDFTGRFRDASPRFYRECPGAITRLTPWLNRELNALLMENTQNVMMLVDLIVTHISRHHIKSNFFRRLLRSFLGNRTRHFVHEFHNYMKSPYDMVGYDRHCSYVPFHEALLDDEERSSDEDVSIVPLEETEQNASTGADIRNPFQRPMIEVIEIPSDDSNDSDVIIEEPPPPVVVDLVNTTDDDDVIPVESASPPPPVVVSGTSSSVSVDVKISRRKRKRKSRSRRMRKWDPRRHRHTSASDSDDDEPNQNSDVPNHHSKKRGSHRRLRSIPKYPAISSSCSSSSSSSSASSSSDSSSSDSSSSEQEPPRKRQSRDNEEKVKAESPQEKPCSSTSTTSVGTECVKKEYCEATTNTDFWDTYPCVPLDYSLPPKHEPSHLGMPGPSTSAYGATSSYPPVSHWRGFYKTHEGGPSSDSDN